MSDDDDAGDEGRSDRLRRRRSQRTQSDAEREPSAGGGGDTGSDASASGSNTSELSERSKLSEQDETAEGGGVKSEQVGTYMYLLQEQKKEIDRLYNVLKAEYEYEFDEDFEKNRHYYPLLVQYGLDDLDGLDASELRERLASL